ncbi:NAD-dependent protein deacetylase Hst1p [Monosporozyma servazzii]
MVATNLGQGTSSGKLNRVQNEKVEEGIESMMPVVPVKPVGIAKNLSNGKYVFPNIAKEDIWNARMFLKYYGVREFLDKFLPNELNSLYLYFLIKLLGFESKDRLLVKLVEANVEAKVAPEFQYTYTSIDDPLEKKYTVKLIKDLQKAMNKILSTRMRLNNFYTIDHFVARLQKAKNIIVLTGAGVSTSLGIPDFRSSEGFYSKIKHLGLEDPQDVFNYEIFMRDPSIFYSIANMVLPPEGNYSILHSFIAMLSEKGKLLRNYTQNIDNLESYAGIPRSQLVQCHGSFATASCVTCRWSLSGEKIFGNIRRVELPLCPYCFKKRKQLMDTYKKRRNGSTTQSGDESEEGTDWPASVDESTIKSYGVLKPDITFFGEALPTKFHKSLREDISKCDMLICIGTSLKVAPVSEIVNMIPVSAPQILINRAPVKHAVFDLSLLGYCDDIATLVTKKCGWEIKHPEFNTNKNKNFELQEKERGVYDVATTA